MNKTLKMTPVMQKYYNHWLKTKTLLGHPHDRDKFYQFVNACMKLGRNRRSGSWLREFLEIDIKGRFRDDYTQNLISRAVTIFDNIVEYENVVFPDPMVELKDPVAVRVTMSCVTNKDGTSRYTDQEIQAFIEEHVK